MNWTLLEKLLPIALRTAKAIFDGVRNGEDNEEIRRRVTSSDVILDEDLDALRESEDDLEEYIRTGR